MSVKYNPTNDFKNFYLVGTVDYISRPGGWYWFTSDETRCFGPYDSETAAERGEQNWKEKAPKAADVSDEKNEPSADGQETSVQMLTDGYGSEECGPNLNGSDEGIVYVSPRELAEELNALAIKLGVEDQWELVRRVANGEYHGLAIECEVSTNLWLRDLTVYYWMEHRRMQANDDALHGMIYT